MIQTSNKLATFLHMTVMVISIYKLIKRNVDRVRIKKMYAYDILVLAGCFILFNLSIVAWHYFQLSVYTWTFDLYDKMYDPHEQWKETDRQSWWWNSKDFDQAKRDSVVDFLAGCILLMAPTVAGLFLFADSIVRFFWIYQVSCIMFVKKVWHLLRLDRIQPRLERFMHPIAAARRAARKPPDEEPPPPATLPPRATRHNYSQPAK